MDRSQAKEYVGYVVDDAGSGRRTGADPHAMIREGQGFEHHSVLVGWQCGFEPMFVAVHSYLDVELDDEEAVELATDFLQEINWFAGEPTQPDYILR